MLESGAAPLPNEHGAPILERTNPDILLIARPLLIDPKYSEVGQTIGIDPVGADSKPVTISHIILPDYVPTVRSQADLRINLVSGKISCDWVFPALRSISVLRQNSRSNPGK